jgi:hypothetical protein
MQIRTWRAVRSPAQGLPLCGGHATMEVVGWNDELSRNAGSLMPEVLYCAAEPGVNGWGIYEIELMQLASELCRFSQVMATPNVSAV